MKRRSIFFLLTLLFALGLVLNDGGCGMFVYAGGPTGQVKPGVAYWISDARGWRQGGTFPQKTTITISCYDTNWVKDDHGRWIRRWEVAIDGVDVLPETQYGSPVLGQAGQPIQIGEVVYAKSGCRSYLGPWECDRRWTKPIAKDTPMKVVNRQNNFLFVHLNSRSNQPAWVKESSIERKVAVATDGNANFDWDNVVLVVAPLASHLAGNGRSINVTLQQAEEAFRAVLAGRGQIFSRASDGRIMFDIVLGPYRYVGFVNSLTGNLDNFFLPAERYQEAHQGWNIRQVLNYVENLKAKGGYSSITPDQVPDWIKQKWLGASPLAMARAVIQTSEVCMVFMIMPQYQLQWFERPGANITN